MEVGFKHLVLLQQTLYSRHGVAVIPTTQQVLLLRDPRLLLLHVGTEHLIGIGLLQFLPSVNLIYLLKFVYNR